MKYLNRSIQYIEIYKMFIGFDLKEEFTYPKYRDVRAEELEINKSKIFDKLSTFINDEGILNGDLIQKGWFPKIEADVFISHSHKDLESALCLAGWLKEIFDLKVFIDSSVWGFC